MSLYTNENIKINLLKSSKNIRYLNKKKLKVEIKNLNKYIQALKELKRNKKCSNA